MSMCSIIYDKEAQTYDLQGVPDMVLDVIIEKLWESKDSHWIAEELSDNQAEALCLSADIPKKAADIWNRFAEVRQQYRDALTMRNIELKEVVDGDRSEINRP